jgi:peptidoglycan/xylan/chitin deacetylase (PgdA/CDA1 family)
MKAALQRALFSVASPRGARGRLIIFSFHRTPEHPDSLLTGEPDAQRFGEILKWIGELCRVLPLDEAVRALREGRLPDRAAAITFDDGYRNNLTVAKPALMAAGFPATVFVAVDPVKRGIMWNDLVIESVRRVGQAVDLEELDLGVLQARPDRWSEVERLIGRLKYRDHVERLELAEEVHRRVVGRAPERQMLTEAEVLELQGDGVSLGAHTVNHPILAAMPDREAEREICESRDWLNELTGTPPTLFAYPNGRPGDDYDARHVAMVKRAGFAAAMSTEWAAAHRGSPLFELPRFTPWERSSLGFGIRLIRTCLASYR